MGACSMVSWISLKVQFPLFYKLLSNAINSTVDMEVRKKAIDIVLSMTSSRNVEEVVLFLKKQLQRTQEQDFDKVCIKAPSLIAIIIPITRRHQSIDNCSYKAFTSLPSNFQRSWLASSLLSWNSWVILIIRLPWMSWTMRICMASRVSALLT
jgi:hypothetical protein